MSHACAALRHSRICATMPSLNEQIAALERDIAELKDPIAALTALVKLDALVKLREAQIAARRAARRGRT